MHLSGEDALNYRRGRSGRPLTRAKARLKREGSNVCWLCGKGIDLTLPHSHPMAWTMDHALPLSEYPTLALDPTNHREAHRSCNSRKGKKINYKSKTSRNW